MINIDGVTKDDVKVPEGELGEQLEAAFEKGDDVRREAARLRPSTDFLVSQIVVTVVSAMGTEQAMSYKEGQVRRNPSDPPRAVLTFSARSRESLRSSEFFSMSSIRCARPTVLFTKLSTYTQSNCRVIGENLPSEQAKGICCENKGRIPICQ